MHDTQRPVSIELHRRSRELELGYADGSHYRLSCEYLRVHSPSAEVQGHGPGQEVLQTGKLKVGISDIRPVGNYALQLVFDTSMDLRKALPLALDATGNDYYRQQGPQIAASIGRGMTLHQALDATGAFPRELLDAIAVGEQSGMLAETMQRQSNEYRDRAALARSTPG